MRSTFKVFFLREERQREAQRPGRPKSLRETEILRIPI